MDSLCEVLTRRLYLKQREKIPSAYGFACYGMQIAISMTAVVVKISWFTTGGQTGAMVLDNMVLAHSSVAWWDMDRSKDRDRSSSLLKREPKLP